MEELLGKKKKTCLTEQICFGATKTTLGAASPISRQAGPAAVRYQASALHWRHTLARWLGRQALSDPSIAAGHKSVD